MASKTAFATEVLRGLGIKPNAGNLQAMVGWMNAEGGHWNNDARYNPLNTTQPEPGAGNTGTQGNIKVYKSWDQGIKATVTTLQNGRYGSIIHALRAGNPQAVASAIGSTPWGTSGGLVARAIAGAPKGLAPQGGSILGGSSSAPSGGSTGTTTTTTTPGVNNHAQRAALFLTALTDGSFKDPNKFAVLAANLKGAQDIAPTKTTKTTPGALPSTPEPSGATGKFKITGPDPGRIKPEVVQYVEKIAGILGTTLVGSDGSGHSRLTVNGNVSEHTTGNATDIPASGAQLIRYGQAALIAAGMPAAEARKQKGGLYNVGNHQIIFNTHIGGDHTNHLHVSTHAKR